MINKPTKSSIPFLLLVPSLALAADETTVMDTVLVTATRSEKDLKDVSASVSVITKEAIEQKATSSVANLLSEVPGVMVTNSQGIQRVRVRGESSNRVLIIVDGQKVSDQTGMEGSPLLIDPSTIERIEVIKGPSSVLYGSEAIGGVINITTKKGGDRPLQLDISSHYNSASGEFAKSATFYGASNGFEYRLSASGTEANELRTGGGSKEMNSDFKQKSLDAFVAYSFGKHKVGASGEVFNSDLGNLKPFVTEDLAMQQALPEWSRKKVGAFYEFADTGATLERVRVDVANQETLKDFLSDTEIGIAGIPIMGLNRHTLNKLNDLTASIQTNWLPNENNELIVGSEFIRSSLDTGQTVKTTYFRTLDGGTTKSETKGLQDTLAVYAQNEYSMNDNWLFTVGSRYTHVTTKITGSTDSNVKKDSKSDGNVVFSLGSVYTVSESLNLRGQFSQGYRNPTLQDMFVGSAGKLLPNPNLKAEKSNNIEFGLRYNEHGFDVDVVTFYSQAKDYITAIPAVAGTSHPFIKVNRDNAETLGLETSTAYRFTNGLKPYANLSLIDREFTNNGKTTSKTGTPSVSGSAGLGYERAISGYNLYAKAYSNFANGTEDSSQQYAGWATANIGMGIGSKFVDERKWNVNLALENLFDKKYQQAQQNRLASGFNVGLSVNLSI
ncbi:TonB-dependent receptor [Vibrio jasicida]|uniref:TonB-dependent receptor n=1 Tax=Vibrio jasicida TaxID=766224 RepID=UPI000CE4FCE2|nr:TonB-dependent receptor [Vibrio jasicida]